ncbi:MAG: hypothetical protein KAI33_01775 [Elusimicrobiales bacterium]|nr:hypothetical protein [Elusimicrobiales bacterium]
MNEFKYAEKISRIKNPLDWTEEKNKIMVKAVKEMAVFHNRNSDEIKALYAKYKFKPESIRTEKDFERIPAIGVNAMKYHLLTSLPHKQLELKLTSSGTRGQKTQIWFDKSSLDRVQAMLETLWRQEGFISSDSTNYLMFVYDPADAKNLGISFSNMNQQRFAPVNEAFYALKKNKAGEWEYRKEAMINKLKEFAKEGKPVRMFGIPSFIYELFKDLPAKDRVSLPKGSFVFTAGGWKAAEDKKVEKDVFRKRINECTGIPSENIRDGYGMAEHSAPYEECSSHRFHIPVYNRILARDPVTMKVLPNGEPGLLEFITPFNAMMPNLAIVSTDIGYIDKEKCDCGHSSPTFTLVGRGGLVKHKGCAIQAADILKKK